MTDCRDRFAVYDVLLHYDWVYGQCRDLTTFCFVVIRAPADMLVLVELAFTIPVTFPDFPTGKYNYSLQVVDKAKIKRPVCQDNCSDLFRSFSDSQPWFHLSSANNLSLLYLNSPPIVTRIETVPRFVLKYTSGRAGHLMTPHHYSVDRVCGEVKVPPGHVVMVSFLRFSHPTCRMLVTLQWLEVGRRVKTCLQFQSNKNRHILVYNTTRLAVCADGRCTGRQIFFELLFSFQSDSKVLDKLKSGLYNCSVEDYWRYRHHLECNLKVECEDGRDEAGHCPFSSPACPGWVASLRKCYREFRQSPGSPEKAQDTCRAHGYELASVKTQEEFDDFKTVFSLERPLALFGLMLVSRPRTMPFMYRFFFCWTDKTIIYNIKHIALRVFRTPMRRDTFFFTFHAIVQSKLRVGMLVSVRRVAQVTRFFCEMPIPSNDSTPSQSVEFSLDKDSSLAFQPNKQLVVICPKGHVTHAFLSCDYKSHCRQTVCYFIRGVTTTVVSAAHRSADAVVMFSCSSGDTELSYSLLCDFRQDCADNSDESFCHHPTCTELACTNGQCVSWSSRCNGFQDCVDGYDEEHCNRKIIDYSAVESSDQNNSYLINFDGRGYFTHRAMNLTEPCPGTHYRCTKEWFYCLPIYTRCNGVFDCIFQEDERDCVGWTCPGLYRCRGSTVCVHADHMCDGWPQCPQRDDEWLCDMTCPAQCLCQGHAFLCPQPFSAHLFPQLRYLDARGSGMTPSDLRNNTYIVRLSLVRCSISILPDLAFHNLQVLDLSHNQMTSLVMSAFKDAQSLKTLILKWNPLTSVTANPPTLVGGLRKIDLSGTRLDAFDSQVLSCTPGVHYINVSFSMIRSLDPRGFQMVTLLKELDITGTMMHFFPPDLFQGLIHLDKIYSSNYRLCCKEILPNVIPQPRCRAPQHYLSSCDDMLRSDVYRLSFWFVAVLASLVNLVCFLGHCVDSLIDIPYRGPVAVFMASLQCADFCTGMYSSIISAADQTLRGQFVLVETVWTDSVTCKVAGFLSLLSHEVTTLITFLLTLQHLLLLCFPSSAYRFSQRSAAVACGVTWAVGILLASVPLLPALSHWGHYGHTALCSIMLLGTPHVGQTFRFIHVILIVKVFICFTVFAGLYIVYRTTPRHRVLCEQDKDHVYASVDLLMKIASIDVGRWLAATTTTALASAGVLGTEVNVFVVAMVLPLNSAVNPVLCLWHAVTYKQRRKQEARLLRVLKSRNKYQAHATATNGP